MMASTIARVAFYAFLVWVPIPLGSNRPVFWAINAAIVLALFVMLFLGRRSSLPSSARRTLTLLIVPALALLAWMLIQALPWTPDWLHHPAWSDFGVAADGAISANPAGTLTAALQFFTIAMAGIVAARISMSGRRSLGVLRAIIASASVVAVWGLVAVATGSPPVLFGETGSTGGLLTSFFVNRNTAATFLAIGLVAALAAVLMRVRASDGDGGRMAALADLPRLVGPMLAIVVLLGVALVATGSRAGVIAGTLGALATFLVGWRSRAWIPQAAIGVALLVVGGAVLLFGTSSDTLFLRLGDLELAGPGGFWHRSAARDPALTAFRRLLAGSDDPPEEIPMARAEGSFYRWDLFAEIVTILATHFGFDPEYHWSKEYPFEEFALPLLADHLARTLGLKRTRHFVFTAVNDPRFAGLFGRDPLTMEHVDGLATLGDEIFSFKFAPDSRSPVRDWAFEQLGLPLDLRRRDQTSPVTPIADD